MYAALPVRVRTAGPDTRALLYVCGVAAVAVAGIWLACASGSPNDLDRDVYSSVHGTRGTAETALAKHLTVIGNGAPMAAVLALLWVGTWWAWRRWEPIAVTVLALVIGTTISTGIKVTVGRSRPPAPGWLSTADGNSFPSGHTTAATAGYLALAMSVAVLVTSARIRALVLLAAVGVAVAVGWTRVELGVHWPTDVLAGWAVGTAAACAALACWALAPDEILP